MRGTRAAAAAVFAAALAFRLLVNAPALVHPERALAGDSVGYRKAAANVLEHGHHLLSLHRPPGYPWLLAALGNGLRLPLVFNLAADAVTAALLVLAVVGRGRPLREGLLAGGLYALHPLPAACSGLLLSESAFTLAFTLALLLGWRARSDPRLAPAFGVGLLFGASILLRAIAIYLVPLLLAVEVGRDRAQGRRALACLAGVLVATLPFVLLHGLKLGEWTVATTGRGSLVGYEAPAVLSLQAGRSAADFLYDEDFLREGKAELGRRAGWGPRGETHDARSVAEARDALRRAPHLAGMIHGLGALKSLAAWDLGLPLWLPHAPAVALGLFGLWRFRRDGWTALSILVVLYLLLIPGPASEARFLMPALPLLCLAAARAALDRPPAYGTR